MKAPTNNAPQVRVWTNALLLAIVTREAERRDQERREIAYLMAQPPERHR